MIRLAVALWFIAASAWAQFTPPSLLAGMPTNAATPLTISCAGTGTTSSTISCTGAYSGTAPTSISTATWQTTCSGSSTITSFSASGGTLSFTASTPSSACTGALQVTDNRSDTATSGSVVISLPGYVGPLDVIGTWTGFYASRAASSATRGNKIWNVCDALDAHCVDVLTDATTGAPVIPSSNPNCSGGACTIKTWYDLSGNSLDRTQTVIANRFTLNPSVIGSVACGQAAGSTTGYPTSYVAGTDGTQPWFISAVAERTGSLTTVLYVVTNDALTGAASGQLNFAGTANFQFYSGQGAAAIQQAETDNAPHAVWAMANSTSSKLSVDGASPVVGDTGTGVGGTNIGIGKDAFASGNNLVGIFCEGGRAPGDQSASGPTLEANQRSFYGF